MRLRVKDLFSRWHLWQGIRNDQLRLSARGIAADEFHRIGHFVVVIILAEIQAELGQPDLVDFDQAGGAQCFAIPGADRCAVEGTQVRAGCSVEIAHLKRRAAKTASLDLCQQVAQHLEGITAKRRAALLDFQRGGLNLGIIGQGGCIESQDGPILAVGFVVAQLEGRTVGVDRAAQAAGFLQFAHPAILQRKRIERKGL